MKQSSSNFKSMEFSGSNSSQDKRLLLREAVRNKIVKDIIGRAGGGTVDRDVDSDSHIPAKKFAMILDPRSTRVLSSALHSHDLADEGVALTESLTKSRQPFPSLEAIYLVDPTEANLLSILYDFSLKTPNYFLAHVFLLRSPDEEIIRSFLNRFRVLSSKVKPARRLLASLLEVNLDFLAAQDHLFHLDLPLALEQLFGPVSVEQAECEKRIVSGVASVCASLNEFPFIRFSMEQPLAQRIANSLNDRVERFFQDDDKFWFHGDAENSSSSRGTILFLDRRDDVASCFLHEFTYQALVFDLLKSRDAVVEFGAERRKAQLDDSDELFVQFRFDHVQVVIDRLRTLVSDLSGSAVGQYQRSGDAGQLSLEEMGRVVKELPLFKEVMARHALHMAVCQACMDRVSGEELIATSNLEQLVVTGVDAEGDRVSETRILNELATLMRRREVAPGSKLRVACLHAVTLGSVNPETVQKFIRDCDPPIPADSQAALLGLAALGVQVLSTATGNGLKPTLSRGTSWFSRSSTRLDADTKYRSAEALASAKAVGNALSAQTGIRPLRFSPLCKPLVDDLAGGRLDPVAFPFVKPPPPGAGEGSAAVRVSAVDRTLSVRTHFAEEARHAPSDPARHALFQGGRLIVFVCGGVTLGEVRAMHEVMKSTNREVIVGSTHIIKPEEFLDHLKVLGGNQEEVQTFLAHGEELALKQAKEFYGSLEDDAANNTEDGAGEEVPLGLLPRAVGYIPCCGKRLAAWLNGEDGPENEGEEEGNGWLLFPTRWFKSSKLAASAAATRPLREQGAAV